MDAPKPAIPAPENPTVTPPSAPAPSVDATPSVTPPAAPKPVVLKDIFELAKDGKTYVFASNDALAAFSSGTAQKVEVERTDLAPGATVVLEASDPAQAAAEAAAFAKLHPLPTK